jgi:hypothetical protein
MGHSDLNLSPLLALPGFRSDLLYFIRMAGNYIESIFLDTRDRWTDPRKRAFQATLDTLKAKEPKNASKFADLALRQPKSEFAFAQSFRDLLAYLPATHQQTLADRLQQDHALPFNFDQFFSTITLLRDWRNYLEHAADAKPPTKPDDGRLLEALGLLLLPYLHNHLVGCVAHHARKVRLNNSVANEVRARLRTAEQMRRETSRKRYGRKTRGTLGKNERIHQENSKTAWMARYAEYFAPDTWPRHNYHNFKIRWHFMGRHTIRMLEQQLQGNTANPKQHGDFMREIEPLYGVMLDIHLHLHSFLEGMKQQGLNIRERKTVGPLIVALRNEIAHGGCFWQVKKYVAKDQPQPSGDDRFYAVAEIFAAVLNLPSLAKLPDPKAPALQLADRLRSVLKQAGLHRVYLLDMDCPPNQLPAPLVVRRWTPARREKFANKTRYRIDKRERLRAVLAAWQRALSAAQQKN